MQKKDKSIPDASINWYQIIVVIVLFLFIHYPLHVAGFVDIPRGLPSQSVTTTLDHEPLDVKEERFASGEVIVRFKEGIAPQTDQQVQKIHQLEKRFHGAISVSRRTVSVPGYDTRRSAV
jgi:hypothetical protein